jgi:hypothetical protein
VWCRPAARARSYEELLRCSPQLPQAHAAQLAAAALPGRPWAALMEEDLVGEVGRDAGGQTTGAVLATEQDGAMRHGQVGDLGRGRGTTTQSGGGRD